MVEDETSEAALAVLLAETLAAAGWWEGFGVAPDAEQWRPAMAEKALLLYARTNSVIEASLSATEIAPVHRAVAVLREIADAAAMRSCVWEFEGERPVLPTRAQIELFIRLDDVDDWAAEHGHPLRLESEGIPEEVWPENPPVDADPQGLVEVWMVISDVFDRVVEMGEEIARAREAHRVRMREANCELLYAARGWATWARRLAPMDGEAVVASAILMGQALYVVATQESANPSLFPSRGFLREFLTDSGALDWLTDQGAEIPDWLA